MPIAKELALKILGALAVGGTAVGGGIALKNLSSKKTETENNASDAQEGSGDEDIKVPKVLEELGLSCGEDNFCILAENKSLSVKQEDNAGTLTALPADGQGGKIKIHKTGEEAKSTFSIEVGDITPTWQDGSSITKLEEFETYEIEEEGGEDGGKKYHFKRRTKALEGKAKALGLTESECTLPTGEAESTTSTCELDLTKLKAINFEGKTQGSEPTMTGDGKATLTITKLSNGDDPSKYPMGYKFTLSGEKVVKVPATPRSIIKKANVSVEFKIKVASTENGPKTLSLEKVSRVENLAEKFKLTECKEEGETRTCKLPKTGVNAYKDSGNYIKGTTISNPDEQTVNFEEDVPNYEGGIKFTVSSNISISGGSPKGTFGQISAGDYEIKEQTVDDAKAWYLTKRDN